MRGIRTNNPLIEFDLKVSYVENFDTFKFVCLFSEMEKSDLLVHIQKLQLSFDQEHDQRIKMEQQIMVRRLS